LKIRESIPVRGIGLQIRLFVDVQDVVFNYNVASLVKDSGRKVPVNPSVPNASSTTITNKLLSSKIMVKE
jgi:hypothetical protein